MEMVSWFKVIITWIYFTNFVGAFVSLRSQNSWTLSSIHNDLLHSSTSLVTSVVSNNMQASSSYDQVGDSHFSDSTSRFGGMLQTSSPFLRQISTMISNSFQMVFDPKIRNNLKVQKMNAVHAANEKKFTDAFISLLKNNEKKNFVKDKVLKPPQKGDTRILKDLSLVSVLADFSPLDTYITTDKISVLKKKFHVKVNDYATIEIFSAYLQAKLSSFHLDYSDVKELKKFHSLLNMTQDQLSESLIYAASQLQTELIAPQNASYYKHFWESTDKSYQYISKFCFFAYQLEKDFDFQEGMEYTLKQLEKKLMLVFGDYTVESRARQYFVKQYPYIVKQIMNYDIANKNNEEKQHIFDSLFENGLNALPRRISEKRRTLKDIQSEIHVLRHPSVNLKGLNKAIYFNESKAFVIRDIQQSNHFVSSLKLAITDYLLEDRPSEQLSDNEQATLNVICANLRASISNTLSPQMSTPITHIGKIPHAGVGGIHPAGIQHSASSTCMADISHVIRTHVNMLRGSFGLDLQNVTELVFDQVSVALEQSNHTISQSEDSVLKSLKRELYAEEIKYVNSKLKIIEEYFDSSVEYVHALISDSRERSIELIYGLEYFLDDLITEHSNELDLLTEQPVSISLEHLEPDLRNTSFVFDKRGDSYLKALQGTLSLTEPEAMEVRTKVALGPLFRCTKELFRKIMRDTPLNLSEEVSQILVDILVEELEQKMETLGINSYHNNSIVYVMKQVVTSECLKVATSILEKDSKQAFKTIQMLINDVSVVKHVLLNLVDSEKINDPEILEDIFDMIIPKLKPSDWRNFYQLSVLYWLQSDNSKEVEMLKFLCDNTMPTNSDMKSEMPKLFKKIVFPILKSKYRQYLDTVDNTTDIDLLLEQKHDFLTKHDIQNQISLEAGHTLYVEKLEEIASNKRVSEDDKLELDRLRLVFEVGDIPAEHVHFRGFRDIFEEAVHEALNVGKGSITFDYWIGIEKLSQRLNMCAEAQKIILSDIFQKKVKKFEDMFERDFEYMEANERNKLEAAKQRNQSEIGSNKNSSQEDMKEEETSKNNQLASNTAKDESHEKQEEEDDDLDDPYLTDFVYRIHSLMEYYVENRLWVLKENKANQGDDHDESTRRAETLPEDESKDKGETMQYLAFVRLSPMCRASVYERFMKICLARPDRLTPNRPELIDLAARHLPRIIGMESLKLAKEMLQDAAMEKYVKVLLKELKTRGNVRNSTQAYLNHIEHTADLEQDDVIKIQNFVREEYILGLIDESMLLHEGLVEEKDRSDASSSTSLDSPHSAKKVVGSCLTCHRSWNEIEWENDEEKKAMLDTEQELLHHDDDNTEAFSKNKNEVPEVTLLKFNQKENRYVSHDFDATLKQDEVSHNSKSKNISTTTTTTTDTSPLPSSSASNPAQNLNEEDVSSDYKERRTRSQNDGNEERNQRNDLDEKELDEVDNEIEQKLEEMILKEERKRNRLKKKKNQQLETTDSSQVLPETEGASASMNRYKDEEDYEDVEEEEDDFYDDELHDEEDIDGLDEDDFDVLNERQIGNAMFGSGKSKTRKRNALSWQKRRNIDSIYHDDDSNDYEYDFDHMSSFKQGSEVQQQHQQVRNKHEMSELLNEEMKKFENFFDYNKMRAIAEKAENLGVEISDMSMPQEVKQRFFVADLIHAIESREISETYEVKLYEDKWNIESKSVRSLLRECFAMGLKRQLFEAETCVRGGLGGLEVVKHLNAILAFYRFSPTLFMVERSTLKPRFITMYNETYDLQEKEIEEQIIDRARREKQEMEEEKRREKEDQQYHFDDYDDDDEYREAPTERSEEYGDDDLGDVEDKNNAEVNDAPLPPKTAKSSSQSKPAQGKEEEEKKAAGDESKQNEESQDMFEDDEEDTLVKEVLSRERYTREQHAANVELLSKIL